MRLYRTRLYNLKGLNRFYIRGVEPRDPIDIEFNGFIISLAETVVDTTGTLALSVKANDLRKASSLRVTEEGVTFDGTQIKTTLTVKLKDPNAPKGS